MIQCSGGFWNHNSGCSLVVQIVVSPYTKATPRCWMRLESKQNKILRTNLKHSQINQIDFLTRMIEIILMNLLQFLLTKRMIKRILQIKNYTRLFFDNFVTILMKTDYELIITWFTRTTRWSCNWDMIILQTVVFPEAVPPATPELTDRIYQRNQYWNLREEIKKRTDHERLFKRSRSWRRNIVTDQTVISNAIR